MTEQKSKKTTTTKPLKGDFFSTNSENWFMEFDCILIAEEKNKVLYFFFENSLNSIVEINKQTILECLIIF